MIIYYTVPETQHVRCNFYFSFWAMFCPFTTLTAWKKKISKKWKNASGYHQFTQVYQKSWSHAILFLRYGTWQMKIFHFGLFFVLLPPPPSPNSPKKRKFNKKWKEKFLEISSYYTNLPKIMIICYNVPEIWCVTDVIVIFHFGISPFFTSVPNIMIRWCWDVSSCDIVCNRPTDGQRDRPENAPLFKSKILSMLIH